MIGELLPPTHSKNDAATFERLPTHSLCGIGIEHVTGAGGSTIRHSRPVILSSNDQLMDSASAGQGTSINTLVYRKATR